MVGGMAMLWRETLSLVASVYRKVADEAEELERQHGLRRTV